MPSPGAAAPRLACASVAAGGPRGPARPPHRVSAIPSPRRHPAAALGLLALGGVAAKRIGARALTRALLISAFVIGQLVGAVVVVSEPLGCCRPAGRPSRSPAVPRRGRRLYLGRPAGPGSSGHCACGASLPRRVRARADRRRRRLVLGTGGIVRSWASVGVAAALSVLTCSIRALLASGGITVACWLTTSAVGYLRPS